jgi:NADPH:quinone reductase-like Zn-dependent oxidoreductase
MRVVQFDEYGPPEVLHLAERDEPVAGPGEVRIRVVAAGLNPADYKWRSGTFREGAPLRLPHVLGYDAAGFVDAVGPGVTAFRPGDRIVANVRGGYAELAIAQAAHSAKAPDGVDLAAVAVLPCAGLSGLQLIEDHVRPLPGETVLITGATGAAGRAAVHAAQILGARVVAAVRPYQIEEARRLGADLVLPLEHGAFADLRFDHIADTVAGPVVGALCRQVAPGGRIRTIASMPTGLPAEAEFCGFKREGARLARLANDVATGAFVMPIAHRMPLACAAEAHRLMEAGGLGGKIVLEL